MHGEVIQMISEIGLILFNCLFCIIIFCLTIYLKEKINLNPNYNPIQKIHGDYTPPYGGIVIFVFFYLNLFLFYKDSVLIENYILIPAILIFISGSIEDIYGTISPVIRFLTIFISSIMFVSLSKSLPIIDFWILGNFINENYIVKILFFSIGLTALSNGTNMIDGMNGLSGFTILTILLSIIIFLKFNDNIEILFNELLFLICLIIIFLIFNFPLGKIFLGDGGAYWLGWLSGSVLILIFSNNSYNTWIPVLIIFYPIMEVVFSTLRKLLQKKNPLKPDLLHLHLKLYNLLKGPIQRSKKFNSFTTLCLMPFWSMPLLTIIWVIYYAHIAIGFIIFMSLLYIIYYFIIPYKGYK